MKKLLAIFSVLCGVSLIGHAQTTAPKMAAYSVDSVQTQHAVPAVTNVLAPFAIDSVSTGTQGPVPELRATKKEDPDNIPK